MTRGGVARAVVRPVAAAAASCAILALAPAPVAGADKWGPIDPKELAATTPVVQQYADAEVLLWDIKVEDVEAYGGVDAVYTHYLRVKIYTDHGRDTQSRVDLGIAVGCRIDRVEGRSIRRDGSFVELKKADVFERTVVKAGGLKVKATSFVLPAVETGGIVEYRWREIYQSRLSQNLRLPLSRDIPVQLVKYHIVPYNLMLPDVTMHARPFHVNSTLQVGEEKRVRTVSMANVPADIEEPNAPPVWDLRPWMLVYYRRQLPPAGPERYWLDVGKRLASGRKSSTEVTPEIQRAVASLGIGSASIDEKLTALVAFCRARVRRVDVDTATDADRKGFSRNKSATAALAAGSGTADDVLDLFVASARAAGLDARLARIPRRDNVAFSPSLMLEQLMDDVVVAVRDGHHWRFLDPGNDHASRGHPMWSQESMPAVIADEQVSVTGVTPVSPPEFSLRSRTATLRLSEDGTLEGDVTTESHGHPGMILEEQNDHLSTAERETAVQDLLVSRMPGAEVTGVVVDNVTDPDKPFVTRYHLKVPGYAQRTGSRLFFQPDVFQKGIPPVFPAPWRRFPIFFEYAWKDVDRVRIELPAGYHLEAPEAAAPLDLAPAGAYSTTITRAPDGGWIELTREFSFGGGNRLEFPVEGYSDLKRFFDQVARADARALTLTKPAGEGGRP